MEKRRALIFVVGPTASGKTSLGIEIALKIAREIASDRSVEIISADSVQFYNELKIGSARPTESELARVKHHFVGHVSVAQDYTAGDFERDAMALVHAHPEKSFVVVGGSGFYIQAFENGMYPIFRASDEIQARLEMRVDSEGLEAVYRDLARKDPELAKKIAPQDRYRIVRSLEILETLKPGDTISEMRDQFKSQAQNRFPGRDVFTIGLRIERQRLEKRVVERTKAMLDLGLVDEVRALAAQGYSARPALQSVGYKEVLQFLRGELSLDKLPEMIVQGTLRLAKKQRTWFARYPETAWFDAEHERSEAVSFVLRRLHGQADTTEA